MIVSLDDARLGQLRRVITENLRVQRGGADPVPFIDPGHVLDDTCARQNHVIFGRRGCGKTLLLQQAATKVDQAVKTVYLNCEDFKRHSFPNVLIEILDALFKELESHLTGWFGMKVRSRDLIQQIRKELKERRSAVDITEEKIRRSESAERSSTAGGKLGAGAGPVNAGIDASLQDKRKEEIERTYSVVKDKIRELDMWLPRLKEQVREFFQASSNVKAVYLQIDDFYHLIRADQPLVMDYIHRLCKDLPLYFKVATLRHASTLYSDREGQPIGAQERHDYQPIDIDYTFRDFLRTREQNKRILSEFGKRAGLGQEEVDGLFKGEGFDRLIMAGGGVPRDCLSLFLEVLGTVQSSSGDRIGKDEVRILSRANFERRIEELKQDSEGREQDTLLKGIYVIREFCIGKKTNVFLVPEQLMQQRDEIKELTNRLLDYRIIHSAGSALTHKSQSGTYQAYAIDIGCYANLRKLEGRFNELDITATDAKERMRSAPIFDASAFENLWKIAPENPESALKAQES